MDKTTRQLSTTTLFDEAKFKALHDDTALEHGIYSLLGHLNGVLDANAKEYQKSVHSISKMKYDYSTVTDWIQL
ncbi:hypothetical protein IJM86_05440 [bacterium]|nr:hypothetical protein [bacterium]